ncbi:hypothetical protein NQ314_008729 [Rhamnusium bicolor]|uniref:Uncharacterized protein n=1 Tax=Rhamnusium bicolor TaxID=1586634 RepID=A0AAV8Y7P6_9CUCU|nr:hypothetical protein NQ314_008729 [Rhamnusium bicolor]
MFSKKYLEYLFKNGKPFKEELLQFVKEAISEIVSFLPNIKNPAIEKDIFVQVVNIIPEVITESDEKYKQVYRQLIVDLIFFNNNNTENCINLLDFPNLITFIKSILDKTSFDCNEYKIIKKVVRYNYKYPSNAVHIENAKLIAIIVTNLYEEEFCFSDLIEYMVTKKNRSEFENEILQLYFNQILDKHAIETVNFWFLRNEPLIVIPYFDKIIKSTLNMSTYRDVFQSLFLYFASQRN